MAYKFTSFDHILNFRVQKNEIENHIMKIIALLNVKTSFPLP
jgi:hypothetical protein